MGRQDLHALAQHCSITERNADEAENESLQEQRLAYYATRLEAGDDTVYEALITGVVPRGLLVELEDSLQRGLIPLSSLPDDYYTVEMTMGRIKGRQARHTFRVGTRIKVRLLRVDTQRKLVDFRMAGYEASPVPRQSKRPARRKQKPQRRRQRMR